MISHKFSSHLILLNNNFVQMLKITIGKFALFLTYVLPFVLLNINCFHIEKVLLIHFINQLCINCMN